MSQQRYNKNSLHNDLDPDFDLDSYIHEKSNEGPSYNGPEQFDKNRGNSFLKNAGIILVSSIIILLYWNWSPKQTFMNIFGLDEGQQTAQAQTIPAPPPPPTTQNSGLAAAEQAELERAIETEIQRELANAFGPEQQRAMQEAFAELSTELSAVFQSEEFQQLQLQGLQAATQALQNLDQAQFNQDEQKRIEEALAGLEEAGIIMGSDNATGLSFSEYRAELGLEEPLDGEQIANALSLYINEVPLDFIRAQQEQDPDITFTQILNNYNQEG